MSGGAVSKKKNVLSRKGNLVNFLPKIGLHCHDNVMTKWGYDEKRKR
jgi:hypothetical protein